MHKIMRILEVNPIKEFSIDELDYFDKHLTDSQLLHNTELPDIKFINKIHIAKVVSLSIDKYCEKCGKNTRRTKFLDKQNLLFKQIIPLSWDAKKRK